jgi:two-component system, chemotaxis family, CheB/CheR fusion protein
VVDFVLPPSAIANFPMHIFGSDLSQKAIEKARAALYGSSAVSEISPERLTRFFVQVESGYQIVRSLRDRCVFAVHNLAAEPPFSRMDLISCRNLLINFGAALQQRVMSTLFHALQPDGFLVLGQAERPGSLPEYFEAVEWQANIYTPKLAAPRTGSELPARVVPFPAFSQEEPPPVRGSKPAEGGSSGPLQRQVDRLLLAQYAPPSVVVDDKYRIIKFRGDVGSFLARMRERQNWICSACSATMSPCTCG